MNENNNNNGCTGIAYIISGVCFIIASILYIISLFDF